MRARVKLYQLETPNKSTGMNEAGDEGNVVRISWCSVSGTLEKLKTEEA